MDRSYRGLGLVVLMLLVVAPLTLFAVLSLFEDESADEIKLSLDGEHWTSEVDGALLASAVSLVVAAALTWLLVATVARDGRWLGAGLLVYATWMTLAASLSVGFVALN